METCTFSCFHVQNLHESAKTCSFSCICISPFIAYHYVIMVKGLYVVYEPSSQLTGLFPPSSQLRSAKVALESPEGLERGVQLQMEREVWGANGCSEFFRQLHFEPSGRDPTPWVVLTAPASKLDRKTLHFAATAVIAVFGE